MPKTEYITNYTPSLLESIARNESRKSLGITPGALPFRGMDIWNAYELTWLNGKGRPEVAVGQFQIPCNSPNMVESKSLKMYLGSFSQTRFKSRNDVASTLESDLSVTAEMPVIVVLSPPDKVRSDGIGGVAGQCLDILDIEISEYNRNPGFLEIESEIIVREALYTDLVKTICPVSGQPDFASVSIEYHGRSIKHDGLLRYLISYHQHEEFCEQVVERIFVDIMNHCAPDILAVQAKYARRGGIDINPYRSHNESFGSDIRNWRQ